MMKKPTIVSAVWVLLMAANLVRAEVCEIFNGSFELDERIVNLALREPNGWDVNMPAGKFRGYVYTDWPTDGQYNLTLYADWFVTFKAGDTAGISQELNLTNVNQIVFDLKLQTYGSSAWDPAVCTPVLMIDKDIVWKPDAAKADIGGEYRGRAYAVADKYRDHKPHKLSLGLKVNAPGMLFERYFTQWDFLQCTTYCGGGGLLPGDFNRDCYVDVNDLKLLADAWASKTPLDDPLNLFSQDDFPGSGGTITFLDFARFAPRWDGKMAGLEALLQKWLQEVKLDDPNNFFHGDDVQPHGAINFFDFVLFAEAWLGSSLPAQ